MKDVVPPRGRDYVPPPKAGHSRSHLILMQQEMELHCLSYCSHSHCSHSHISPVHSHSACSSHQKMSSHSLPLWLYLLKYKMLAKASDKATPLFSWVPPHTTSWCCCRLHLGTTKLTQTSPRGARAIYFILVFLQKNLWHYVFHFKTRLFGTTKGQLCNITGKVDKRMFSKGNTLLQVQKCC